MQKGAIMDSLASHSQLKAIERVRLNKMPFDRFEDGIGFIHATGYEVKLESGEWILEYEDDVIEDAVDCVYSQEETNCMQMFG